MGVFSRLNDIVSSNLTALLDRAEDPEKIVRLIIQEMEDTLVEVRSRAARAIADRKETERKRAEFAARVHEWEAKAELAIVKGRDDLARGAIAARHKAEEMVGLLERELEAIEHSLERMNEDLAKLQTKLDEARARQRSLVLRRGAASEQVRVQRQLHDGRIEEALARYERYERRIDELEGEAESYALGRPKSVEQELRELAAEDDVNSEFERLKKRVAERAAKA